MQYTVQDAARLLNVSEETIYRFIREEHFPAVQFNDRYHINRQRLIEWAHERHLPLVVEMEERLPSLDSALAAGDVLHHVEGETKRDVLRAVTERMPLPESVDREFLFEMIWSREQLGSTGFGKGIAIPHARRPIMLDAERSSMTVAFLKKPVDFHAADGQPVSVLFLLVTSTIRLHLHLLARLGNALNDGEFLRLIRTQSDKEALLARLHELEYSPKNPVSFS
ncbi:MAG: PTS sugar transporter subunit IIA [Candidatus Omnitrophota bacterium]